MKNLLPAIFFLLISTSIFAQKDKQFWFAAPYISEQHGNLPINIQIATYEQAASIEISIPANKEFKPIIRSIPAFTSYQVNLDPIVNDIISKNYNVISNKGIYVKSSSYISASYEVLGYNQTMNQVVNSDIFALKGNNALGQSFFTPFQNSRENQSTNITDAYSAFHIVATENNTLVTITPTKALYGHPAGIPFSIILNKGQTYSCRALGKKGNDHPAGTEITSNKPIAITVTDDSVLENGSYDLLGDQIVPIQHLGREYIIPRMDSSSINFIYILGIELNTEVIINQTDTFTISRGQTLEYKLEHAGTYVHSNNPIYVWHLGSLYNEMGAAIIPKIDCSGSKSSIFVRKSIETFGIVLVTKSNSTDKFRLNGTSNLITANDFKEVTGNPDYQVYFKLFTLDEIKLNQVYNLTNLTSDFQMGIISAENWGSFRYGYFSNFSPLNLGPDQDFCINGRTLLDAGPDNDSYTWSTGETSQEITVSKSGEYSVMVKKGSCTAYDTVQINVHPLPVFDLGADIMICKNENVTIFGPEGKFQYLWNTKEKSQSIKPIVSATYTLEVTDTNTCKNSDSIKLEFLPLPKPIILFENSDQLLCDYPTMTISTEKNYDSVIWNNGDTTRQTLVPINETYTVIVKDSNQCKGTAEKTLDCSPFITIYNLCTPNQDGKNDYFIINGMHNQQYTLEVYNRWGAKVYYQDNYNNDWTPSNLQNDIYYYILSHSKKDIIFKDWLQIIR